MGIRGRDQGEKFSGASALGSKIAYSLNNISIIRYQDNGTGMRTSLDHVNDILIGVVNVDRADRGSQPLPLDSNAPPTIIDNGHLNLFA